MRFGPNETMTARCRQSWSIHVLALAQTGNSDCRMRLQWQTRLGSRCLQATHSFHGSRPSLVGTRASSAQLRYLRSIGTRKDQCFQCRARLQRDLELKLYVRSQLRLTLAASLRQYNESEEGKNLLLLPASLQVHPSPHFLSDRISWSSTMPTRHTPTTFASDAQHVRVGFRSQGCLYS